MWPGSKQPDPATPAAEATWVSAIHDMAISAAGTVWNGPLFYVFALLAFALVCDLVRRIFFMRRIVFRDMHVLVTVGSQGIG